MFYGLNERRRAYELSEHVLIAGHVRDPLHLIYNSFCHGKYQCMKASILKRSYKSIASDLFFNKELWMLAPIHSRQRHVQMKGSRCQSANRLYQLNSIVCCDSNGERLIELKVKINPHEFRLTCLGLELYHLQ